MSNPAVIKLHKKNISRSRIWLDDNVGESIHIHIDDIRVDLKVQEFYDICASIEQALDTLISVDGFSCKYIDPIYMESMLSENLLHLRSVRIDNVKLSEMLAPGVKGIKKLSDSRAVRALKGDTAENDLHRVSHHIGQSSAERLDNIYNSVIKNGYPWSGHYIIMYGDDNIIRDGQHRAACLYVSGGDRIVPVVRLYFDNYTKENNLSRYNWGDLLSKKIRTLKIVLRGGVRGFVSWIKQKRIKYNNKKKLQNEIKLEKKLGSELVMIREYIDNK